MRKVVVMHQVLGSQNRCCRRSGAGNYQIRKTNCDVMKCGVFKKENKSTDLLCQASIKSTTTLVGEQLVNESRFASLQFPQDRHKPMFPVH